MKVRVEMGGVFGLGSCFLYWPEFSAHAVEFDKPFLSSTGYSSFHGLQAEERPGMTPIMFARDVMAQRMETRMKGKPVAIEEKYRTLEIPR